MQHGLSFFRMMPQLRHPRPWTTARDINTCLRGKEYKSLLVAARTNISPQLRLIHWHKTKDGDYTQARGQKTDATTRIMVVDITTDLPIHSLGKQHKVMVVHMHNSTVTKNEKVARYWTLMAGLLRKHDVKILAGDFNMAMLTVLMKFRARGFCINAVAIHASKKDGPADWCQHTGDSNIVLDSTCGQNHLQSTTLSSRTYSPD